MSDVNDDAYLHELARSRGVAHSSMDPAERAAPAEVIDDDNALEDTANAGRSHDDEWQHVEHPSEEADHYQAAEQVEGGENNELPAMTVPEMDAALDVPALEDFGSESAASSQHSGHSFEHLSDHFGEVGTTNSLTTSSRSSLDGLLVHSSSFGSSLDGHLVATSETEALGSSPRMPNTLTTPAATPSNTAEVPSLVDAASVEATVGDVGGEVVPSAVGEVGLPTSEVPDVDVVVGGMASPVGSSYVNLQAAVSEGELSDEEPPSIAAGSESDVDATDLDGLPIEDWDSENEESDHVDGSAVWDKNNDEAKHTTWMDALRAAVATFVPTAAIATVYAWIENWRENLRALEMPAFGRLPVRLLGMNRSTLVLGVGGVTIAVISSMLYNSRQQNMRLRMSLYERDQDVARMVARIFRLQEALQPRRIPIIHHVSSTGFSAFPALPTLAFM